ncbi:very short patch repair endonuclease [Arthrobacter sp. TMN-37]
MADTVSREQRSRNMSKIRGRNTQPELAVRRLLHRAGYRYRLHGAFAGGSLPGRPDLVFAGRRKVVFVNGCFWHSHSCRAGQRSPSTNSEFWTDKREGTRLRDQRQQASLRAQGWDVFVVWECELKQSPSTLEEQLTAFLGAPPEPAAPRPGPAPAGSADAGGNDTAAPAAQDQGEDTP